MEKTIKCCFTGYRPHKFGFEFNEDNPQYVSLENKVIDAVFSLADEGCYKFYCGMAMGFDLLAAETVVLLKKTYPKARIELVAVIPFEKQSDSFDETWKKRYDRVLRQVDSIVYISREYYKGCYYKRNCYMVDNSDVVITWFDGQTGGTAQTLNYAARKGKRIVNLLESGVHEYFIDSPYDIIEDEY